MWPRRLLAQHPSARLLAVRLDRPRGARGSLRRGGLAAAAGPGRRRGVPRRARPGAAGADAARHVACSSSSGPARCTAAEVSAQRASGRLCGRGPRTRLVDPPGRRSARPASTDERVGEVGVTVGHGVDALDAYTTRPSCPPRRWRASCPLVVLVAIGVLDPLDHARSCCSPGPMLVLLLAVIGGRTRALTERRFDGAGLAERVLPRHDPGAAPRSRPSAGPRTAPTPIERREPPLRRHDDGGAAHRVPDLAGDGVGGHRGHRAGRGARSASA